MQSMSLGDPLLLGVNYWPRRKAMYWWAYFDAGEVREEFAIIGELGLRFVRILLLGESFQPRPDEISTQALADLRTVCAALKDHPALWAWSLGNEPDLFCRPPIPEAGAAWVDRMTRVIHDIDADHLVTIGLHAAALDADVGFHADQIAKVTDLSVMHGYSIYNPMARRPLDPDYVPFTCALSSALAGRPVLYEEFGLCTRCPDEDSGCHIHERFFGLVRADGTPKPMALAVKEFAATRPVVRSPGKVLMRPVAADMYYQDPMAYQPLLYERFGRLS